MQLTIDTQTETPRALRAYARILAACAELAEASTDAGIDPFVVTGNGEFHAPRDTVVPAGTINLQPPMSNVLPFVQPSQTAPTVTVQATSAPNANSSATAAVSLPPAPTLQQIFGAPPPATAPITASHAVPVAVQVPQPAVTASLPAANPGTATADGQGLDKRGLPWDARINSSGDNKLNADGTWRAKRGANPLLVQQVETELRTRLTAPAGAVPPAPVASPVTVPVPLPPAADGVPPLLPSVPAVQPVIPLPPPAASAVGGVPAAAASGPTFLQLITQANRYATEGRYDMPRLNAAVVRCGGSGLEALANNVALVSQVWNAMETEVGVQPRAF